MKKGIVFAVFVVLGFYLCRDIISRSDRKRPFFAFSASQGPALPPETRKNDTVATSKLERDLFLYEHQQKISKFWARAQDPSRSFAEKQVLRQHALKVLRGERASWGARVEALRALMRITDGESERNSYAAEFGPFLMSMARADAEEILARMGSGNGKF